MNATRQPVRPLPAARRRGGFTLVELLVTITVIAILASVLLGTLFLAGEKAKDARTRSMIARLDQAITVRWESYRTRRVPIDVQEVAEDLGLTPENPYHVALARLMALRELMRMELPDRWTDITDIPVIGAGLTGGTGLQRPSISRAYLERHDANVNPSGAATLPTREYEGAECLYLIVTMGGLADDAESADKFRSADVGDTDADGMLEFLDGWGNPIQFLRWAPGFVSDRQPMMVDDPATTGVDESLERDVINNHDPFDPLKVDLPEPYLVPLDPPKFSGIRADENPIAGYRLFPLIYSPGPDGVVDIRGDLSDDGTLILHYNATPFYNDPYHDPDPSDPSLDRFIGSPADLDNDGLNDLDNIHNHMLGGTTR